MSIPPGRGRPAPRDLTVIAVRKVTPNMLRVTLGGPGLAGFPTGQSGGYLKLNLPSPADAARKVVRTYTIAAQRDDALDIDFALHGLTGSGIAGPATGWAIAAKAGDTILVVGPGPAKPLPPDMDFYLVVGDMTALPAITVNLAALPADARGMAVIQVIDEADCQRLARPEGVDLRWVVGAQPGSDSQALAQAVRDLEWTAGNVYAWSASEFSSMQRLRTYLRDERGLGPDQLYISSYWKSGLTEDDHKAAKREDAGAQ